MTAHASHGPEPAPDHGPAAHSPPGHPPDEPGVHLFEVSGLREGSGRVPRWLLLVMAMLFGFCAWYLATQSDAQPSAAKFK